MEQRERGDGWEAGRCACVCVCVRACVSVLSTVALS